MSCVRVGCSLLLRILRQNNFESIPSVLSHMKGLMKIDLQDNYLGPVDFTDFAGANITQLYLDYNVDMGAIYGLDKLSSVRFLFVLSVCTGLLAVDNAS